MTLDTFDAYDDCAGWPYYVVRYAGSPVGKVWSVDTGFCFVHYGTGIEGKVPTRELAGRMVGELESRDRSQR
jgi:hypothetical protein